jgi:hypothetical protein
VEYLPAQVARAHYEGDRLQYIPIIDAAARAAYALAGASGRYSSRIEACPHGLWPVAQIGLVDWICEILRCRKPPGGTLTLGPPPPGSRGVGDDGALIAPMAAALSRDVARARVVTTRLPSLDEDVVTKQVPHTPFWAHRLLWVADVPELVALLKSQGRW